MQISEAWALVCELAVATGARKIAQQNGCWEYAMQPWHVSFNPHSAVTRCTHGVLVPEYMAYIEFGGRPVGFLSPQDGAIAEAFKVSEEILIAALHKRIDGIRKPVLREGETLVLSCQAV